METVPEIVFTGIEPSDFVRARIEEEVAKLEQFHGRLTACRVVVEAPHRHHHQGILYNVRIHVTLPGHADVLVNHNQADKHAHEDAYVAIRDAFSAARRQLQDRTRKQQGQVKTHEPVKHGRVARLIAEGDYGFIDSADGQEVYFHANSVIGGFEALTVGSEVRFDEELGDKGLQATTVHPVGKHHPQ